MGISSSNRIRVFIEITSANGFYVKVVLINNSAKLFYAKAELNNSAIVLYNGRMGNSSANRICVSFKVTFASGFYVKAVLLITLQNCLYAKDELK
jgi:hypothetical protein